MKNNPRHYNIFLFCALAFTWAHPAFAVEPNIADYTNLPVALTQATQPNIMIMLDNSGSMNFNAYGTYPGDSGTVAEPYEGAPFCGYKDIWVTSINDDAESDISGGSNDLTDNELDLGTYNADGGFTLVGVRFKNIVVPKGRTITKAYIQFTAHSGQPALLSSTPVNLTIFGEKTASPVEFGTASPNRIYDRYASDKTTASAAWTAVPSWSANQRDANTRSPELKTIVQELVNMDEWDSGNSMVFMIAGATGTTGVREVYSYSGSTANAPQLHIEFDAEEDDCTIYYGYFDPRSRYNWGSNKFERAASGSWHGNWLNWATMRRIDILRKVLVGGLATSRQGGGNTTLLGEIPEQTTRIFKRKYFDPAIPQYSAFTDPYLTPYHGNYVYGVKGGDLYVDLDGDGDPFDQGSVQFRIEVQKDVSAEPQDFLDGNIVGVMQRVGTQARWGNSWFYLGTGNNEQGGYILRPMGANDNSLITTLQNTGGDTWTPLAESLYVVMQYFKQQAVESGLGYSNSCNTPFNNQNDPYYNGSQFVKCAKSFVLLLTDGASTKDSHIPASLKTYGADGDNVNCDEDTNTNCDLADGGTNFLDNVALYARANDLRADLEDTQNLLLYVVYAFDNSAVARSLLRSAAKNGGFYDKDSDGKPDTVGDSRGGAWSNLGNNSEWDKDGDGIPDNYYEASDGYLLEKQLLAAITDILKRASSGTAVSVLATKGEGEGIVTQAFFKPSVTSGLEEIKWTGYLQALWVDRYGQTREDTDGDKHLDVTKDDVIKFYLDSANNETKIKRWWVTTAIPYPDTVTTPETETAPLDEVRAIWEGGQQLSQRDFSTRKIFTYTGGSATLTEFSVANRDSLKNFFGIEDNATDTWSRYLGAGFNNRAENLINFIRGADDNATAYNGMGDPDVRHRFLSYKDRNGINQRGLWKLGDIVNSTPVTIAKPVENYGSMYDDASYYEFLNLYRNRETVVYVGANDGMLHAFSAGVYNSDNLTFQNPYDLSGYFNSGDTKYPGVPDVQVGNIAVGEELWGYIPQTLLPHLKWLPDPEYTHVYYVDLMPKVTDVRIFESSEDHPEGWGTVLIGGLNWGGKQIATANAGTFGPSFFCLDVSNPRNPRLLWEKSYANMGFSATMPCVMQIGAKKNDATQAWENGIWYLAIGSGPTTFSGSSSQLGHVLIIDLKTGNLLRDFATDSADGNAYMSPPVALDKGLKYNADALYVSANYSNSTRGRMYKIVVPQTGRTEFSPLVADYDTNTANWSIKKLFGSLRPITAPAGISTDKKDNVWVYFGTGRFIENADKTNGDQNYIYGIKDPFFNLDRPDCYRQYNAECQLAHANLFDANGYVITSGGGTITGGSGSVHNWADLLEAARDVSWDGWYRTLENATPSERIISKPAILGGIMVLPSFKPNTDPCSYGGASRMYTLFYETGTAYKARVIGDKTQTTIIDVTGWQEGVPPPTTGIHIGREEGGTLYTQLSTGEIVQIDITPAFNPKSVPIYWKEEP